MLNWAQRFNTFCFLDNHQYQIAPHTQECLIAAGIKRKINATGPNALDQLQKFVDEKRAWLFGHLCYDLITDAEFLHSPYRDPIQFPDLFFFEPAVIIRLDERKMVIEATDPEGTFIAINSQEVNKKHNLKAQLQIKNRLQKDEYLSIIRQLQKHILRGDCYEINFCQEFYAEGTLIDPAEVYRRLVALSPNPFSALYRLDDKWLICASPERFLKKQDDTILSQPIKGTARRELTNKLKDDINKQELFQSQKDRSENVMVVDLVRNDLSKICKEGSVSVDELYGIYSFPQVHQMISTVSGTLRQNISLSEIIRATFPMGSMTGAPKKRVMELIDQYEITKRGIFSGCVGYVSPDKDFDLNVVIRSIMYNTFSGYLSIQAGSGITYYSDPAKEWEECLLKAEALINAVS